MSDALAVKFIDTNSPDIARCQEWTLANIHKAEEHTPSITTGNTHQLTGDLSSSPQQLSNGERVSDGSVDKHFGGGFTAIFRSIGQVNLLVAQWGFGNLHQQVCQGLL